MRLEKKTTTTRKTWMVVSSSIHFYAQECRVIRHVTCRWTTRHLSLTGQIRCNCPNVKSKKNKRDFFFFHKISIQFWNNNNKKKKTMTLLFSRLTGNRAREGKKNKKPHTLYFSDESEIQTKWNSVARQAIFRFLLF